MNEADALSTPMIPASWGEVIDKMTILEIKAKRIADPAALANVGKERDALAAVIAAQLGVTDEVAALRDQLRDVNARLWDVEDAIRDCEHAQDFGDTFIALARSVYQINDQRARFKREINLLTSSGLVEEKSYR